MDVCFLGEELATLQTSGFNGGRDTSRIIDPLEGEPGTMRSLGAGNTPIRPIRHLPDLLIRALWQHHAAGGRDVSAAMADLQSG